MRLWDYGYYYFNYYYFLLGLAAKVDPKEKEKQDTQDWLNDGVEQLNIQVVKIAIRFD